MDTERAKLPNGERVPDALEVMLICGGSYAGRAGCENCRDRADQVAALVERLHELWQQAEIDTERKVDAELRARVVRLEAALGIVRRMALDGPGPGTTEEQALATIAEFARLKLAALVVEGE